MNFRTEEYFKIRIAKMKAKGEVMNEKLIKKVKSQLSKLS